MKDFYKKVLTEGNSQNILKMFFFLRNLYIYIIFYIYIYIIYIYIIYIYIYYMAYFRKAGHVCGMTKKGDIDKFRTTRR